MKYKIIDISELKFVYKVFENGDVFNLSTGKQIKPSKDKRRPNEPPIIYLKKKDNKRVFIYQDQLIAKVFIPKYILGNFIYHKDGDVNNCNIDNIIVGNGLEILKYVFNETKEWKPIDLKHLNLYYEYYICEDGRVFNGTTGSFIKPFVDRREGNYNNLRYNLYYGKSINEVIHYSASRLVAEHFLPKPPKNKMLVLFKDRDHSNLHYTNLFYGDNWDSINQDIPWYDREEIRDISTLENDVLGIEQWKELKLIDVKFDYCYLISNYGRIYNKSKKFYCSLENSSFSNLNGQYYKKVNLKTNVGYREFSVHRLVAITFVKNYKPDKCVNHINGNPECNIAINLEWVTHTKNIEHAIKTNLIHTKEFSTKCNTINWRMNVILAWIFSIPNISNKDAYSFYMYYMNKFNDNIDYDITFDDFISIYKYKLENDDDFNKLKKFYQYEYSV